MALHTKIIGLYSYILDTYDFFFIIGKLHTNDKFPPDTYKLSLELKLISNKYDINSIYIYNNNYI